MLFQKGYNFKFPWMLIFVGGGFCVHENFVSNHGNDMNFLGYQISLVIKISQSLFIK